MNGYPEPLPEIISPNPGGENDPLGESIMNLSSSWLRVFEPQDVRLVIGRNQNPLQELEVAQAQADGIPIHRRMTGGGAVILAPGMVVVAMRLARQNRNASEIFGYINPTWVRTLNRVCGATSHCRGLGDIAIGDVDGIERKILGASLKLTSNFAFYLGAWLVKDNRSLMEQYLKTPSRQPEYRQNRGHRAFCTSLDTLGLSVQDVIETIKHSASEVEGNN